jgi:hypothetical protein
MTGRARHLPLLALLILGAAPGPEVSAQGEPQTLRVTNLEPGTTLRYPVPILRGECDAPDGTPLRVENLSSTRPDRETRTTVQGRRFRALAGLVPGANVLSLTTPSGGIRLPLRYRPATTPLVVRFVWLTDSTGGIAYQSERADDPQDFAAKIDTAAKLMQSFTAERLNDEGYGRRTFALELDDDGRVRVRVVRAERDAAFYRGRTSGELYGEFNGLLGRLLPTDHAKNAALMAFTRFNPLTRQAEAHTALGGGGLGLFGSGGVFSWPGSIGSAQAAFSDATRVDGSRSFDDSSGRGSYWGLASTTIGAMLHEMGHTFDLPHSNDGYDVMTRGFDHFNRAFTVIEPPSAARREPFAFPDAEVAGFGRISSPRLAYHRYFEPDARAWRDSPPPAATVDRKSGKVVVEAAHGLRVVGIDAPGESRGTIAYREAPPRRVELDIADLRKRAGGAAPSLHLIDDEGNHVWVGEADLADPSEFVRAWRFAGDAVPWAGVATFPELPKGGVAALVRTLEARPLAESGRPFVNLLPRYRPTDNRAACALAVLRSPRDAGLRMLTGSDDALRVWINGDLVTGKLLLRGAAPDQDRTDVSLRKGENRVLVEVSNGGGAWGFYLRFEDPAGGRWTVGEDGETLIPPTVKGGDVPK